MSVDWAVKLDKADFVGKPELVWQSERGEYPHLVAMQPEDPGLVIPEACQLIDAEGRIMGRITSSRMSPTLGRSICLGQVSPELDVAGGSVTVRLPNGKNARATVLGEHAHFDPQGARARA